MKAEWFSRRPGNVKHIRGYDKGAFLSTLRLWPSRPPGCTYYERSYFRVYIYFPEFLNIERP